MAAGLVAYALSPIDLVPNFIPILGYLGDLVVIPLGLLLIRRSILPDVWTGGTGVLQSRVGIPLPSRPPPFQMTARVVLAEGP